MCNYLLTCVLGLLFELCRLIVYDVLVLQVAHPCKGTWLSIGKTMTTVCSLSELWLRSAKSVAILLLKLAQHGSLLCLPSTHMLAFKRAHTDRSLLYTLPGGEPMIRLQIASLQRG